MIVYFTRFETLEASKATNIDNMYTFYSNQYVGFSHVSYIFDSA